MAREWSLGGHSEETEKAPGSRIGTKEDPEEAGRAAGQPHGGLSETQSPPTWGPGPAGPPSLRTARRTGSVRPTHNHYSWRCRPWTLHTAPGSTQKCELGLSRGSPSWALRAGVGRRETDRRSQEAPHPRGQGESLLLPVYSNDYGSRPNAPRHHRAARQSSLQSGHRQAPSGAGPPSAPAEEMGALGVLCFLIQWCQTLISPQKHGVTPRVIPRSLPPPAVLSFWGSLPPQLTPAPRRTSLAEGEVGGRVDARHGGGEADWQSQGFWGQEGRCVCVSVCACACECVRTWMCLPYDHHTLCMYACFCKKEEKNGEKNLNNKCFICFKKKKMGKKT